MRWLRIATVIVGILMLGAWAAGSYLLGREEVPAKSNYRLDVAELRSPTHSIPGDLPLRINYQQVATASLPRAGVFAGE